MRNRTNGGEGASGAIRSDDFKKKISIANKGKTLSKETKDKISKVHKRNKYWLGKKLTKEHKEKCAKAKYGNGWNCKKFSITFDNGEIVIINGLRKFAKENGYNSTNLSDIANGRKNKHKNIVAVERLDATSGLNT